MTTKRITVTQDEQRIILDALENQIWTYDEIKQKHIGIEDSVLDSRKAEVEEVLIKLRNKLKGH